MVARTWSYSCVHFFCLFFPFCLSLVCQTPSELHAQTHSVKLTHMLKDVFICLPVALEGVCMYVCARVHVWNEGCYCCWVSRFLSCHPACLQGPLQPEEFVFIWFQGPSSHSDMHLVRKKQQQKKTMWGITVLVEEDAGVVYRQCSGSYLPQNTLLFLIRQQIWWKWRLWGSKKNRILFGGMENKLELLIND